VVKQQTELFEQATRHNRRALAYLVNRLSSRLGESSVVGVARQPGAQPEYAYRFRPLAGQAPRRRKSTRKRNSQRAPLSPLQRPFAIVSKTTSVKRCVGG